MCKKQTNMNVLCTTYHKVSKEMKCSMKNSTVSQKILRCNLFFLSFFFELAIRRCKEQIGTYKLGFVYIWDLKSHIPKRERLEKSLFMGSFEILAFGNHLIQILKFCI